MFTWSKYEHPVYASEDKSKINCELTVTTPSLGTVPFTADKNDVVDYGRALYQVIINNSNTIPIAEYVPPVPKEPQSISSGNNAGPTVI